MTVAASWCDPAGGTSTQAVALVASVAIIDPSGDPNLGPSIVVLLS